MILCKLTRASAQFVMGLMEVQREAHRDSRFGFSRWLKGCREDAGLSREEAADQLLIRPDTLRKWECGVLPGIEGAYRIVMLYGQDIPEEYAWPIGWLGMPVNRKVGPGVSPVDVNFDPPFRRLKLVQ